MAEYRFDEKTEQFLEGLGFSNIGLNADCVRDPSIRRSQYSEDAIELYVYADKVDGKPTYWFQVSICNKSLANLNKSTTRCRKLAKQIDDYFKTHNFSVRTIKGKED